MKKILAILSGLVIMLPSAAFAFTLTHNPNTDPIAGASTFHFVRSAQDVIDDTDGLGTCNAYTRIAIAILPGSPASPEPSTPVWNDITAGTWDFTASIPALDVSNVPLYFTCNDSETWWLDGGFGQVGVDNFNFVLGGGGGGGIFTLPATLATASYASVSEALADPGILSILVIAVALPLVFWVINHIINLFPGKLVGKGYDAMDRPFYVRRRGRKTYRDYWEDTKR